MIYISRERNSKRNIITKSSKSLDFFYCTFIGRLLLKIIVLRPVSSLVAIYMNSRLSKPRIKRFINKNDINKFEYDDRRYKSYNDFFTRKVISCKRPIMGNKNILISPCDSKLLAYTINDDLTLKIKGSYYSINSLVEKDIMDEYKGGIALVFRLSVDNYHRYCYIDNGTKSKNYYIKGVLHTVQPLSISKYNFFKTNSREYTILYTDNFDKVIEIEIGALMIGRIKNNHQEYTFKKGEEKGYFEFGGSTIVLLFKKGVINLDKDIIENSKEEIETIVKYGEGIGKNTFKTKFKNTIRTIVK